MKIEIINVDEGKTNFHVACSKTKDLKTIKHFDVFTNMEDKIIFEPKKDIKIDNVEYTVYLCYPLNVALECKFKAFSLFSIIKNIKTIYKKIYKDPKIYGIWGHSIGDLTITAIDIKEGNILEINIDS